MIESMSFENLNFSFDPTVRLFEDVSLTLPRGENVWITGGTGSGKSAILKLIAGLVQPISGHYKINGNSVNEMTFEEFLGYRMGIGYSFDYGGLLANRSLRENLLLPLQYHGNVPRDEIDARIDEMLTRFRLTQTADRRPAAVSGSARKTAVIARSLLSEPEVLLLDDPFTGLDRDGVITLLELVEENRKHRKLKHVYFTSRGESVSNRLATCSIAIENFGLKLETPIGNRKAAG